MGGKEAFGQCTNKCSCRQIKKEVTDVTCENLCGTKKNMFPWKSNDLVQGSTRETIEGGFKRNAPLAENGPNLTGIAGFEPTASLTRNDKDHLYLQVGCGIRFLALPSCYDRQSIGERLSLK